MCLLDAECHGEGRPGDASHCISLPEEECQGIFLSNRAYIFQMQSVTAKGVWTMQVTAYAFRMRSVRSYFSQMERMSFRRKVSQQWCPDDVSHGVHLLDEAGLGIFLTDGAHVFLTESVTAKGLRTT